MPKIDKFSIEYSNKEHPVFYPGEKMAGSIILELNDYKTMEAITLQFIGKAFISFGGESNDKHKEDYSIFNKTISIYGKGSPDSDDQTQIPYGTNNYPFTYNVPSSIPCSFEGSCGYVRYYIKAVIKRPEKFSHVAKFPFTVLTIKDLNSNKLAGTKTHVMKVKSVPWLCCRGVSFGCCRSGRAVVDIKIDRKGFVPGEYVAINATVKNTSGLDFESTSASLMQYITYKVGKEKHEIHNIIAFLSGPPCGSLKTCKWHNELLQVPSVPPSLQPCKFIEVDYKILFSISVKEVEKNLKVDVPIIIGTVPFKGLKALNLNSPFNTLYKAPQTDSAVEDFKSGMRAVSLKEEEDNDFLMGQTMYAPLYPYYHWSQSEFILVKE